MRFVLFGGGCDAVGGGGAELRLPRGGIIVAGLAAGNLALLLSAPVWGFLSDIYGRRLMVLRATFVCRLLCECGHRDRHLASACGF